MQRLFGAVRCSVSGAAPTQAQQARSALPRHVPRRRFVSFARQSMHSSEWWRGQAGQMILERQSLRASYRSQGIAVVMVLLAAAAFVRFYRGSDAPRASRSGRDASLPEGKGDRLPAAALPLHQRPHPLRSTQ
eukprot:gnl/Hemi2/14839_TR5036_c0_g1_i1.p2 gnl/Hemi2/14839_TR5036_c0_g1~~gnl/Hemi2/14839_TR5036_c0_g1_i1.p2  ORF type:complete len:133 (-),score=35.92 gnl/Hemi2/14839_TR5036_c0_g1_i1:221-619(-)